MKKTITFFVFSFFIMISQLTFGSQNTKVPLGNPVSIPWIKNIGQYSDNIVFTTKTFAAEIMLDRNRNITYVVNSTGQKTVVLEESFNDCININCQPQGLNQAITKINYLNGRKENHYKNIPTFNSIDLGELWHGINVNLIATNNNFEKILYVNSEADVDQINIEINGALDLCENENKELQVDMIGGDICFTKPIAWQNINGEVVEIQVNYAVKSRENSFSYGFELGEYNSEYPVTIDPLLSSGFLGGSLFDFAKIVKIGSDGHVFVGGTTASVDFPATDFSYDPIFNDSTDVFLARFSNDLSVLEVCTFIGGNDYEYLNDMVLDEDDNVYFTGTTLSDDYPTTPNAYNVNFNSLVNNGFGDIMISKVSRNLDTLFHSTFIGSELNDYGQSIDIDNDGSVFVTGISDAGILSVGPQFGPITNGFVFFKMDNKLSKLLATNSIDGDGYIVPMKLTVDVSDNVLITGYTTAPDFPTTSGSYMETFNGNTDIFVIRVDNSLATLLASTFIGGKQDDKPFTIITDYLNNIYISGETESPGFPFSSLAYDTIYASSNSSGQDAFVSILDSDLTELKASTFLGGSHYDLAYDLALDSLGNIFVTGFTSSKDFPVFCNSYDDTHNGFHDCFVSKFNRDLSELMASTFIGGAKNDHAYSIDISASGDIFSVGFTESVNFPTYSSFDTIYNGINSEGFVFKMSPDLDKPYPCCSKILEPIPYSIENPTHVKLYWLEALGATGYFMSLGTSYGNYDILDHLDVGDVIEYDIVDLHCGDSIYVYIHPYNRNGINQNCEPIWFKTIEPFTQKDIYEICIGDSLEWHDSTYYQTGDYYDIYTDINGCDSTYYLELSVNPTYSFTENINICEGSYYHWEGNSYGVEGIYTAQYSTIYGCDSILTLNLSVNPTYSFYETASVCEGDSYNWHGQSYSLPGNYSTTYQTVDGCDSTYHLSFYLHPNFAFHEFESICEDDTFNWHGIILTQPGTYYTFFETVYGCDSFYELELELYPTYSIYDTISVCGGDPIEWQGQNYYLSGNYNSVYQSINGCDSIYYLNLKNYPNYLYEEEQTLCNNDTLYWQDSIFVESGTYYSYYNTISGCDSVYVVELTFDSIIYVYDTSSICDGDTIIWMGESLDSVGQYSVIIQSNDGCDSIFILDLILSPNLFYYETLSICEGDSLEWFGQNYDTIGDYTHFVEGIYGCDSVFHLNLEFSPDYQFEEEMSICEGETIEWQGLDLSIPGFYFVNYYTIYDCDSIYQLTLSQVEIDTSVYIFGDSLIAVFDTLATYQWLNCPDFDIINGAIESTYLASNSGSYAVQIVKEGCVDTTSCYNLVHSATFDYEKEIDVLVYPNPVYKDLLTIKLNNYSKLYSLKIKDLRGREVLQKNDIIGISMIDVNRLDAGVYIMKLDVGGVSLHKKIVVMK